MGIIPTTVNLAEILGLRDHAYGDREHDETKEVFTTLYKEDTEDPQITNKSKKE